MASRAQLAARGGPALVNLVPGGSTAQAGDSPQPSSKTSSPSGRRRTGPWRPAGRPRVIVAAMAVPSGMAEELAQLGLAAHVPHRDGAAVAQVARAASSRFWTAG